MKLIDIKNKNEQSLRISINYSLILGTSIRIKNIFSHKEPKGLEKHHVELIKTLIENKILKAENNFLGSTEITIHPLNNKLPRRIIFDLKETRPSILTIDSIIWFLLFQKKPITLNIKGLNHEMKTPSINYFKETILRYLKRYFKQYDIKILEPGVYPETGTIELSFIPKFDLETKGKIPPIDLQSQKKLISIKTLISNQNNEVLTRSEEIIRLYLKKYCKNIIINTRLTKGPSTAISTFAFFGNEEGFDNDHAFVKGKESIISKNIGDSELIEFMKAIKEIISETEKEFLDDWSAEFLIPLMALVSGSIPIKKVTKQMTDTFEIIKELLEVKFTFENNILSCKGFFQKENNQEDKNESSPEKIIRLEEL